jgi:two-component system, NarL family, invasion response regulator UvrY
MINVFVTDDHELLREGIKKVLKEELDICVRGEARTAAETLQRIRPGAYDVIILDLSLPDRNGLDIIAEIKELDSKIAVLVLSMYPENQFAERVFAVGADGYLTKETVSRSLVKAIHAVASGRKYVSPALGELLASHVGTNEHRMPHELLSDREFQVFLRLAAGDRVSKIAEDCSLSLSTVYTYRNRILEKTRLQSDPDIIRYALKHNLIR